MSDLEKNIKIKKTLSETKERRKGKICSTFEMKVDKSHLNNTQLEQANKLFLEAKWLYNFILSQNNIFNFNTKINKVTVLNKDKQPEERDLTIIGSQIKQDIYKQIISSIKGLSTKKKQNKKVGKLKFKSYINSINLKQFGNTYDVIGKNKIRIQGIKKPFKVYGLEQLKENKKSVFYKKGFEFANAKFIIKNNDYYFHITCYYNKIITNKPIPIENEIGIDFGIKDDLTLSTGQSLNVKLPINKKIKKEHKRLSKKVKRSNNYWKSRTRLGKQYEKQNNIKQEIRCKTKHFFRTNFHHIAVQDESIHGWHSGLFGKQVQQSAIGGIIREIKTISQTHVVDKWFSSTKTCINCGNKNEIGLEERIYRCECGYEMPRDKHSGLNILIESHNEKNKQREGKEHVPTEHRDRLLIVNQQEKLAEKITSAIDNLIVNCKWISMKQEASML